MWIPRSQSFTFWGKLADTKRILRKGFALVQYKCVKTAEMTSTRMISRTRWHLTQLENPAKALKRQLPPLMARCFIGREHDFKESSWIYRVEAQAAPEHIHATWSSSFRLPEAWLLTALSQSEMRMFANRAPTFPVSLLLSMKPCGPTQTFLSSQQNEFLLKCDISNRLNITSLCLLGELQFNRNQNSKLNMCAWAEQCVLCKEVYHSICLHFQK